MFLAIDGHSIFYRSYYGVRPLSTKEGFPTNAIYGFLNMLLREERELQPSGVAIAFDLPQPTFRHAVSDRYKAQRPPAPDDLVAQLPVLQELLVRLGYPVVTAPGFEADDVLGTLARLCDEAGEPCAIFTGDRDSLQLCSENVTVRLASAKGGGGSIPYRPVDIAREYCVGTPQQLIDVKALQGDPSDNIPGVAGIGPKTACQLIGQHGSLDAVYDNLDALAVTPRTRQLLLEGKQAAYDSRFLATIVRDVPVDSELGHYRRAAGDPAEATRLLRTLEMTNFIDKFAVGKAPEGGPTAAPSPAVAAPAPGIEEVTLPLEALAAELKDRTCAVSAIFSGGSCTALSVCDGVRCYAVPEGEEGPALLRLLADRSIDKVMENAKAAFHYALQNGTQPQAVAFCLCLAGYLLHPDFADYNKERLAPIYELYYDVSSMPGGKVVYDLYAKLLPRMQERGLMPLLCDIELPLSEVLASMELAGIGIDREGLRKFGVLLKREIDATEAEIYETAGQKFNIGSPKQLGAVLFDTLGLPAGKKTKTGYSTGVGVLEALRPYHPVIDLILKYRTLTKLHSTYVVSFLDLIGEDGRIHTTFLQTVARTGRISSIEPNLQNIPVRTALGSELRRFFVAPEGKQLVDADYSQIELRVLASMSQDPRMVKAFRSGDDIHRGTAAEIFHVPQDAVTPLQRARAKTVNFGIIYGMGAYRLGDELGVSYSEAQGYITGYFNTYRGVKAFMDRTVEDAKKTGYVTTLYGRIRPVPEILVSNKMVAAAAERVAKNTPIQGTAADIIKIAMVRTFRRLRAEGLAARLILQVHDELIIEAPDGEVEAVKKLLREEMEQAASLAVPLLSEAHSGATWYDAK